MKSAHRHQLETNELAQRLDVFIARVRPYAATAAGVVVALVVIMFVWSYVSGSSAARQGAAWEAYHHSVASVPPDLDQLRRSAEEYPGSKMQQMANLTWADGQVWMAARDYIYNRESATEAMRRATSAYHSVLQSSENDRLKSRAHLGLARVYEMQNELEKAREEYLKVSGGYEDYAKEQAKRLDDPKAQEIYAWLATAEPPRTSPPAGPGMPGKRPEFSAGDFPLPGEAPGGATEDGASGEAFENMLKGFDLGFPTGDEADRYENGEQAPATGGEATTNDADAGAKEAATPNDAAAPEDAATRDLDASTPASDDEKPAE